MTSLSLYTNSLRHLRPVQLSSRLRMLARRKLLYRGNGYTVARYEPALEMQYRRIEVADPQYAPEEAHEYDRNRFTFLNCTLDLGQPIDWLPVEATQLWKYNLHYFDYTIALAYRYQGAEDDGSYRTFRRLAESWMDLCPLGTPLAWDPYPISLRTSNWIKAYSWFEAAFESDAAFATRMCRSIWSQVSFLEENLEYHLLGNHLIENGRALLLAGLFFQGEAAARWRTKGLQILSEELDEQFLDDGGHYERSPMYHQIMLQLYTDVVDVLSRQGFGSADPMQVRVEDMQRWLRTMLHPDGDIALFNDAAFKIAPAPQHQIEETPPESGFCALPESGYYLFRDGDAGNALFFDCGPLGPDYQPGHGHCDALSYELSIGGQRMIVDSGVSNYYGDEAWRHYYRSTRAHNTVVIDDQDQSEVWGRFRVARRAYPYDTVCQAEGADLAYVISSHTGYRRLPGRPEHRRSVAWIDRRFWAIHDDIGGDGNHKLQSLIHLHPDVNIHRLSGEDGKVIHWMAERGDSAMQILAWGATASDQVHGQTAPIQGWYAPEFGKNQPNTVCSLQHKGPLPHRMGYVLWPGKEKIAVSAGMRGDHQCQIIVSTADANYLITWMHAEVKMEKQ